MNEQKKKKPAELTEKQKAFLEYAERIKPIVLKYRRPKGKAKNVIGLRLRAPQTEPRLIPKPRPNCPFCGAVVGSDECKNYQGGRLAC